MKQLSKIFSLGFVLLSLLILLPNSVSAQSTTEREGQLCTSLAGRQASITNKMSEQRAKYDTAKQERQNERTIRREELDKEIIKTRTSADQARLAAQTKLREKQQTDENKAAVDTYKAAVETAVSARRSAFDTARSTFRASTDNLLENYTNGIESRMKNLESATNQIFTTAQKVCTGRRPDLSASRKNFIASLQDARLTYSDYRRNRQDTAAEIKTYIAARDEAFKAATQTFEQSMRSARDTLTAALNAE